MTFGFMTIVLNGGDYLWYTLANTYDIAMSYPGSIIAVVEGADSFSDPAISTKEGLSIDGTKEIIEKFPDDLGIIRYCPLGKVQDKRDLRNKGLELLRDTDYIVIRDHDEFIKPVDFQEMISFLEKSRCIELQHRFFQGEFGYRVTDAHAGFTLRVFKNFPGLIYRDWHIFPSLNGKEIRISNPSKRILVPFFHYGYVSTRERIFRKRVFTVHQLNWFYPNKRPRSEYQPLVEPSLEDYIPVPIYPWEKYLKVSPDEHPKEMKIHPWFNLPISEIWNWPEQFPTFIPERWR